MIHQLAEVLTQDIEEAPTTPEPCSFCDYCDFTQSCEQRWRDEDSLVNVANILKSERIALNELGVTTIGGLVEYDVVGLESLDPRLTRRQVQAALQKQAEAAQPAGSPPFKRIVPDDQDPDAPWGRGLANLPEPSSSDVFFDIEGHPLWSTEEGLVFLFGLLLDDGVGWVYREPALWAHDREQELEQARAVIDFLVDRRTLDPGMHVYHYNHTERSVLQRIVRGTSHEEILDDLVDSGIFVDLHLDVLKNAFQVGVESYSLKQIERLVGFERHTDITGGSGAVIDYERYMHDQDDQWLQTIARYNEDDVRATLAVRDWLVEQRTSDDAWRDAILLSEDDDYEHPAAELVDALINYPDGSPERLLADLLHYWHREYLAYHAAKILELSGEQAELLDSASSLGSLHINRIEPGEKDGQVRVSFTWPEQDIAELPTAIGWHVLVDSRMRKAWDLRLDAETHTGSFVTSSDLDDPQIAPTIVASTNFSNDKLLEALSDVARSILGRETERPVREAAFQILTRATTRYHSTYAPPANGNLDSTQSIVEAALNLDRSCLIVQGPPGAGKTYSGSEIALHLARAGYSVGVVATGHKAIENFFDEMANEDAGHLHPGDETISMARYQSTQEEDTSGRVDVHKSASKLFRTVQKVKTHRYDITGGALRFFVTNDNRAVGFDYLIVDEAGQVSLADAVAVAASAHNVIFLGDPQQLAHVSQAGHPDGAGISVLRHLVGEGVAVVPRDRGVFLHTSYRMHPSICGFISSTFYDGKLHAAPDCSAIELGGPGVGLTWIPMIHTGRSVASVEEAERTLELVLSLLGTQFVDRNGDAFVLEARPEHFMIVVPFNAQKRKIRELLASDPRTQALVDSVGTVDKFQGRQAAVVIYSMTSSSGGDAPRGIGFLFSRERFNVAISRAKAHAFVLGTNELLNTRAGSIDQMRMIAALSAFVESAQQLQSD